MAANYDYEGTAAIALNADDDNAPEPRIGVRNLDSPSWTADVLDKGPQKLPDHVTVTLREADRSGVNRDGWSAEATCASSTAEDHHVVLNGKSEFHPPAE